MQIKIQHTDVFVITDHIFILLNKLRNEYPTLYECLLSGLEATTAWQVS